MTTPKEEKSRRGGLRSAWPWLLLAGSLALWTFNAGGGALLEHGAAAPELRVTSTDGEFDLGAEEGGVVVLAFWATWCHACQAEGPTLSRVHQRISGSGDRVIGVSVDDMALDEVHRAAQRLGMNYPIAMATRADLERFGVDLLPTIYVIGADHRIAASFTGGVGETTLLEAVEHARDHRVSQR